MFIGSAFFTIAIIVTIYFTFVLAKKIFTSFKKVVLAGLATTGFWTWWSLGGSVVLGFSKVALYGALLTYQLILIPVVFIFFFFKYRKERKDKKKIEDQEYEINKLDKKLKKDDQTKGYLRKKLMQAYYKIGKLKSRSKDKDDDIKDMKAGVTDTDKRKFTKPLVDLLTMLKRRK